MRSGEVIWFFGCGFVGGFMLCAIIATLAPVISPSIAECLLEFRP